MSMVYSDYVAALANLLEISAADADFLAILPRCIDDAEQRLYRELNLVANTTRNSSFAMTANNRNLTIPIPTFVWISNINAITPAGTTNPDSGTRYALTRVSWDYLDAVYGSSTGSLPKYYALQDSATIAFGPKPDAAYQVEIIGAIRPAPISASNTATTLSTYFPDLFIAASMIFLSAYIQNFGAAVDDPKMAMTWEQHYSALMGSAQTEEARKRALLTTGSN